MNNKLLAVILVLGVGWFLISPLFIDEVVDEAFPATIPTNEELEAMDDAELNAIKEETLEKVESMPDIIVEEDMPKTPSDTEGDKLVEAPDPEALLSGQFNGVDSVHRGSGEAVIYELQDGSKVLRFEEFSVTNGPDLRVLLSANESPKNKSEVKDDGFVMLDKLKGNKGDQNYEIPDDVDISKYKSVVIYCYPFNVVFSTADLK